MTESLKGRVVLVTGGGSGIGRQVSLDLAKLGARVAVADVNFEEAQKTVATILEKNPSESALAIKVDVTSAQEVEAAVKATVEKFGRLDGAVNSAGIGSARAATAEVVEAAFDRVIAVNLKGVFSSLKFEIQQFLKQEKAKHYSIVNLSSFYGLYASQGISPYVASKHGVIGLSKTAALEYAKDGIRVNAVCPYFTDTPLVANFLAQHKAELEAKIPLGRVATQEEIATSIIWLLGDTSSFVTGISLSVDGGCSAI